MQIDLKDMARLTAKLRGMGQAVSAKGAERAVRAGAKVIRDAIVDAAPVLDKRTANSTALQPGALKADIRVSVPKNEVPVTAIIGPSEKTAHVARWVEYGHRDVHGGTSRVLGGIGRNAVTRGPGTASEIDVPAHPFLRPAFEASVGGAEEAMVESVSATIQKEVA